MSIYLECYPDETLVTTLGIRRSTVYHAFGKGEVCNQVKKKTGVKAVIDEDPHSAQPTYLDRCEEVSSEHDIRVLQDRDRGNTIIVLCPRLEDWVLKTAKMERLDLRPHGLPEDSSAFHEVVNKRTKNLQALLSQMTDRNGRLAYLKRLLHDSGH